MQDACTFFRFSPRQLPKYGIRGRLVAQLRTLPIYILVVPTIKDSITRLTKLVFLQTNQDNKRDRYIHFWTLRASTHERPPCVLRHTGNAYAVSHIFTHTLPSTIEMAPKHSTLNGQRCIHYRSNVFTSRTNRLTGHPRVHVSQGTRL